MTRKGGTKSGAARKRYVKGNGQLRQSFVGGESCQWLIRGCCQWVGKSSAVRPPPSLLHCVKWPRFVAVKGKTVENKQKTTWEWEREVFVVFDCLLVL
jgi:hypothetical protein